MNLINKIYIYWRNTIITVFVIFLLTASGCQFSEPHKDPFFVYANELDAAETEIPWKEINLTGTSDYAGEWVVTGDIDNDNEVEIISAKNFNHSDNHYTTSVAAFNLDGTLLWEWGDPGGGQEHCSYDVACQIYDLDNDGNMEIVIAGDGTLFVLNGATGEEEWSFSIPANASDCIVFVNLNGGPRPEDILVKTRYSKIWAYKKEGELLWKIEYPGGYRTAHQPYPLDIDGDGKDEIMAGYAMVNHDGSIRWVLDESKLPLKQGHLDCCRVYKRGSSPDDLRLIITCCSDNAIAMIDGNGTILWKITGYHFESIDIGEVCPDYPGNEIFVDIDHCSWGESPAWLLSGNGRVLGRIITDRSRRHTLIDWEGNGLQSMAIGQAQALFGYNWEKKVYYEIPGNTFPSNDSICCFNSFITNDDRMDIVFLTEINNEYNLFIYKNPSVAGSSEFELGTGYNFSLY
ncbi:MAG: hypothetical protein JXB88_25900 [Spirochaetales bacterium]|nr:hypothetical protein [Spirochaetales bacterium]